jgi:hypothetical protein
MAYLRHLHFQFLCSQESHFLGINFPENNLLTENLHVIQGNKLSGIGGPLTIGASNRGDLATAPIYIIGGVIFFIGLVLIFGFQTPDIGLIVSGIGLVLIGVREDPRLSLRWVKYTGPPGLVLCVAGILILMHVI